MSAARGMQTDSALSRLIVLDEQIDDTEAFIERRAGCER